MKTIAIMTYNTHFGKHVDRIIDWTNRLPVQDIICFQEFPEDKIKESVEVLGRTPYGWRFTPSLTFRKRVYGVLTLFRSDKLTLVSTSVINLGLHPVERSLLKSKVPRRALSTTFVYKKKLLRFVNAHFVSLAFNRTRYRQVEKVATTLVKKFIPSVLLGDFNISNILGKKKLVALLGHYGFTTSQGKVITFRLMGTRHQYDYVFVNGCTIEKMWSERTRLSDHYPVFSVIRF